MNALQVSGVGFAYGARQALKDLTFELAPGRFGALLGPNGAGKSTLIALLTRLYDPVSYTNLAAYQRQLPYRLMAACRSTRVGSFAVQGRRAGASAPRLVHSRLTISRARDLQGRSR